MSEALVIAGLATVAVVSAVLSFVAWWLLAHRPPNPDLGLPPDDEEEEEPEVDADAAR